MSAHIQIEEDRDSVDANGSLLGVTDGGKEIRAVLKMSGWSAEFYNGGQLPKQLKGCFTDYARLLNAVQNYLANKPKTQYKKSKIKG